MRLFLWFSNTVHECTTFTRQLYCNCLLCYSHIISSLFNDLSLKGALKNCLHYSDVIEKVFIFRNLPCEEWVMLHFKSTKSNNFNLIYSSVYTCFYSKAMKGKSNMHVTSAPRWSSSVSSDFTNITNNLMPNCKLDEWWYIWYKSLLCKKK